ncbi:MAG: hypothetical protein ACI350_02120 [Prevotella sp.]
MRYGAGSAGETPTPPAFSIFAQIERTAQAIRDARANMTESECVAALFEMYAGMTSK